MEKKAHAKRTTLLILQKEILKKLTTLEALLSRNNDKPLTFREACAYLGYAPSYLYKLTYKKLIPHYKPTGKMIFFSKNELDDWVFTNAGSKGQRVELESQDTSSTTGIADPNQVDMFEKPEETTKKRRASLKGEKKEEVVIEFPLKNRRRIEL